MTPQSCERIRWFCKSGSRGLWTTCGVLFSITYKTALCHLLCSRFILKPGIVTIFIVKTHFRTILAKQTILQLPFEDQCTTAVPPLFIIPLVSVMPATFKNFVWQFDRIDLGPVWYMCLDNNF